LCFKKELQMKKLILKKRNTLDKKEMIAVNNVIKSGNLSSFLGEKSKYFYGGPKVKELEKKFSKYIGSKYAISVNSWTSGLICSLGALNLKEGDEVILSPWTMSACVSSIMFWGAIPIFADIEEFFFTLDPNLVEKKITKKTKAIMAIDIFGQSCDILALKKITKKNNLFLVTDSAQSLGSKFNNKYTGTMSDIGGFSFNYHKHIHCGEGGIIVTNNKILAENCRLIRNHSESVIKKKQSNKLKYNSIGFNFRLGEIESAICIEQLKKLKKIVTRIQKNANYFNKNLSCLKGLQIPKIRKFCTHAYYVYPILLNKNETGFSKEKLYDFLIKKNIPISTKYVDLSELSIFKYKNLSKMYPWKFNRKRYSLKKNDLIITKNYQNNKFLCIDMCSYEYTKNDLQFIVNQFKDFWDKNFILANEKK